MSKYTIRRVTSVSRGDGDGCATVIGGILTVVFWLWVIGMVAKGCQAV